jgi:hypothetical protein
MMVDILQKIRSFKYSILHHKEDDQIGTVIYNTYIPSGDKLKLNSVAFSPQANYTDRATAAWQLS